MKKQVLTVAGLALLAVTTLTSYDDGAYQGGAGIRTTTGCGGCHGASTNLNLSISVIDSATGNAVSFYVPGRVYKVTLNGSNSGNSLPEFGYQAAVVQAANTSLQAGSIRTNPQTVTSGVRASASPNVIEHDSPLDGVVNGGTTTYSTTFNWQAPATGVGDVKIECVMNAVDADGGSNSADRWQTATLTIPPGSLTVNAIQKPLNIHLSPNPAATILQVDVPESDGAPYIARIFDLTGRIRVLHTETPAQNAAPITINVRDLPAGTYMIQISQAGKQQVLPFVKL